MATALTSWQITGDYFENCNCDVVCPCLFSAQPQLTSRPTAGVCDVAIATHIEHGQYGGVSLDGLNAAVMAHTHGAMADGNWSVALYLDERANPQQREALQAIFSGAAGGIMGHLAPLIGTVLGVKFAPITFRKDGRRRMLEIPGVAHMSVQALPGLTPETEIMAVGGSPFNPAGVAFAVGEQDSVWEDYGMRWDNSGKNGHYAAVSWSSES